MRLSYIALGLTLVLASCGPGSTPEAAQNKRTNDAIWSTRQTYEMGGNQVQLAVAPDRSYALLSPVDRSKPLTIAQAEAGIAAATKCTPTTDGMLMMLAGGNKSQAIPFSKMKGMSSLRFDLKC